MAEKKACIGHHCRFDLSPGHKFDLGLKSISNHLISAPVAEMNRLFYASDAEKERL